MIPLSTRRPRPPRPFRKTTLIKARAPDSLFPELSSASGESAGHYRMVVQHAAFIRLKRLNLSRLNE